MRAAYIDLDGTLLGPGGALVHDGDKRFSLAGLRALEACARADVEVVLMSGRRRETLREHTRLLALPAFIAELGAVLSLDGEEHWLTGDWQPGADSIHDQIDARGAPELLFEHYAGRLEYHAPHHHGREVTHLLRGLVDADEATALLRERGIEGLRLVDNGGVHRRSEALATLPEVRAYHLLPEQTSKAAAVAAHMRARSLAPTDCIAIGDSREDLGVAATVGAFFLVANAKPDALAAASRIPHAGVCESAHGAGVYEAIVATLARRGQPT